MHFTIKTITLLLIVISIFACKKPTIDNETHLFPITNPVAMDDRTIGMHITMPQNSDYETCFFPYFFLEHIRTR